MPVPSLSRLALSLLLLSAPLSAQDKTVPYWTSLQVEKANMRVGPATSYRVTWVYKRRDLPLKVVRRTEGWRLVEDPDGVQGWMLGRFLSRERTAIVTGDGLAEMRDKAGPEGALAWQVEPNVVGKLGDCEAGWCHFAVGGRKGIVREDRLWGVGEP